MASLAEVRAVLAEARPALMARRNVTATGVGYKYSNGRRTDELSIICSVESKKPSGRLASADLIPPTVPGVTTDVVATGMLTALAERTGRFRPAPGGVSAGHVQITTGTFGCVVLRDGVRYMLSNNHVFADSNDALPGDAILQPGAADGGREETDTLARLAEYIPIVFENGENGDSGSGCRTAKLAADALNALAALAGSRTRLRPHRVAAAGNTVDCALAEPLNSADITDEILEIGTVAGTAEGELGMNVKKSGRTTGLTFGSIQQIDVTARVRFGLGRAAVFEDQLIADGMAQGGDSGSAVLDGDNNVIGLLFAGSATSTIINRIQNVFAALRVTLP